MSLLLLLRACLLCLRALQVFGKIHKGNYDTGEALYLLKTHTRLHLWQISMEKLIYSSVVDIIPLQIFFAISHEKSSDIK